METDMQNAIEQMKKKEEAGLQYLYSKTYNFVYLRLRSMLKNEETIRELMQKVYSQAYESADELKEDKIYEWLGKTVYILGSQAVKKRKERESSFVEMEENEVHFEEKSDLQKSADIICNALEDLPELYQATVLAFYFDQVSVKEIAVMMGCSTGVVRNRLNYARKYMIKVLQDHQEEEDQRAKEREPVQELEVKKEEAESEETIEEKEESEKPEELEKTEETESEKVEEESEEEAVEEESEEESEEEAAEEEPEEESEEETEEEDSEEESEEAAAEESVEESEEEVTEEAEKVAFTVEALCMAVGKWADEHLLSLSLAEKVGRNICKAENLNPDFMDLDEEESAGAGKTIVSYETGERQKVEEEIQYNQRKKKAKAKSLTIEEFNARESKFHFGNVDKRIVIGIAAGLVAIVGIAAGIALWPEKKEPPKNIVLEETDGKDKPEKEEPEKEEPKKEEPNQEEPTQPGQETVPGGETDQNTAGGENNTSSENGNGNVGQANNGQTGGQSSNGNSQVSQGGNTSGNSRPGNSGSGNNNAGNSNTGNGSSSNRPGAGTPDNGNKDDDKYYIFPESNKRLLTEADVRKLTKEQLKIARNEIYARYGMKFRKKELREYFEKQPWYKPLYWAEEFYERIELSMTEERNINLIMRIEKELS